MNQFQKKHYFNSKMVRLKVVSQDAKGGGLGYFNSKMVRLKERITGAQAQLRLYFNSKMVRLKAQSVAFLKKCCLLFQFQNGAVKSELNKRRS